MANGLCFVVRGTSCQFAFAHFVAVASVGFANKDNKAILVCIVHHVILSRLPIGHD
jgi:hypothetical protein